MKHFNFKSLAFYGVAIGSVLILFKVVTAYGETNLKAPTPISGSYGLQAQNLPNCPKTSELILDIQQSGIYLNGSLLPANVNAQQARSSEKSPSLTGKINNQQLTLAGTVSKSIICNNQPQQVSIQSLLQGNNIVGKLILNTSQEFKFTAQRLAPVPENQSALQPLKKDEV